MAEKDHVSTGIVPSPIPFQTIVIDYLRAYARALALSFDEFVAKTLPKLEIVRVLFLWACLKASSEEEF